MLPSLFSNLHHGLLPRVCHTLSADLVFENDSWHRNEATGAESIQITTSTCCSLYLIIQHFPLLRKKITSCELNNICTKYILQLQGDTLNERKRLVVFFVFYFRSVSWSMLLDYISYLYFYPFHFFLFIPYSCHNNFQ